MNSIEFLEPWQKTDQKIFEEELKKEISPQHLLFGKQVSVIAHRLDQDECLFEIVNENKFAQVHLTWKGKAETDNTWPRTSIFTSFKEWKEQVMIIDNIYYND
jgi:hypothetical protein